ncbi:MAG: helix-turn-helix domain-containing protein [Fidelibacterota bacterium]
MILKTIPPSQHLTPYIKEFWWLENDQYDHRELVYPTAELQILFHYRKPFRKPNQSGILEAQPQMAVCGQNLMSGEVISEKGSGVIGVVFHTYSAHPFLHLPVDKLTNLEVEVADIYKDWKTHENRFMDYNSQVDRIKLIEKFLSGKLEIKNPVHFNIIRESIFELKQHGGRYSVRELAKKYFLSERSFERLYKKHVGISAKKTADIFRFNQSVTLLTKEHSVTEISYLSGFYDQAHFIKNFKQFMGMTPKQYRKLI